MSNAETIIKKILKCGAFCLEFIDDPEVAKREAFATNRVLYSGSAIGDGAFLWLVGELGLSDDGKETIYILSDQSNDYESVKEELLWQFDKAHYVYDALNELVLKDERKDRGEIE